MNEQKKPNGIEWARAYGRRGYTWNVIQGCLHDCHWMVDGKKIECYAKTVAEKFKGGKFFPDGFEHHYFNADRLGEPLALKEPAGIFLDSMSDLMGRWVPDGEIEQVLEVCRQAHWHIFQLLTKNAPRLLKFIFPPNVWPGVSAPPTFMFGKELTLAQQESMVRRQLDILCDLKKRGQPVCWMSIEPLSFDITEVFIEWCDAAGHENFPLNWAVIGAASNGPKYFQPAAMHTQKLHDFLIPKGVKIFHKGNLSWTPHLEEFPEITLSEAGKDYQKQSISNPPDSSCEANLRQNNLL